MKPPRAAILIAVLATVATAATQTATVVADKNIFIGEVDDRRFKSPQQQLTLSAGHHVFFVLVRNSGGQTYDTPQGLEWTLEPNRHYRIVGEFLPDGQVKIGMHAESR